MPQPDSRYHTSPLNFLEEVTSGEKFRLPIVLQDTTLREGEQAAEVAFSVEDRVEVARGLDTVRVPLIQVGFAGRDDDAVAAIKRAGVEAQLSMLCVAFSRDWQQAVDRAADAGVDVLAVLMRTSDPMLGALGLNREEAIDVACRVIDYARRREVPTVAFEPSFVTGADPQYLCRCWAAATQAGAQEVGVSDSLGVAKPSAIRYLVRLALEAVDVPVGIHAHHDFGLSVALALAALEEGAQRVDVSVLGLGERAGGTPLEELVLALEGLYGIDTTQLFDLAQLVHRLTGVPIPASKAVVGENVFAQKLEIHVQVMEHGPDLFEPYSPDLVGHRRVLKLGRGTGPTGVRAKLVELGLQASESAVPVLVEMINQRAVAHKRGISDGEFAEMVRGL